MLLTFATVARSRRAQGRAFVPVWVFLGGYLVLWTAFSLAATLAQWGLHSLALISPMMVGTNPVLGSRAQRVRAIGENHFQRIVGGQGCRTCPDGLR